MVDVYADRLSLEWRETAKTELEQIFAKLRNVIVIVTEDFDKTVTKFLQKRGVTERYESQRAGGEVVVCKVVDYPSNDQMVTCLIINANANMFSSWEKGQAKVQRMCCLIHEKTHILLNQSRYQLVGHQTYFCNPKFTIECMSELANDISSEYIAERTAIESLRDAREGDLTFIELPEGSLSRYFRIVAAGLFDTVNSYLKSFQAFVDDNIKQFRLKKTKIDDFWGPIYLRTRDTLNALALSAAFAHTIPSTSPEFETVKSNHTFKQLFKDSWNEVEQILPLMYANQIKQQKTLKTIAATFQKLFLTFGIELRDTAYGMAVYLKV